MQRVDVVRNRQLGAATAEWIAREHPHVTMRVAAAQEEPALITASAWRATDFDSWAFDAALDELGPDRVLVLHDDIGDDAFVIESMTRAQRAFARRNTHSRDPLFDTVAAVHRALHDFSKPLVRADYNHAVDVWQWLLRIAPDASLALQIAALFHDVERLDSEADARVEHLARDYQAFKNAHAGRGAAIAAAVLESHGAPRALCER